MMERRIAGAMSGTSADGIDVAVTRITGNGLTMRAELLHHHHHPYPHPIRDAVFEIRSGRPIQLRSLAQLARDLSLEYAKAVRDAINAAKVEISSIEAIAAHGQTLFHD